MTTPERRITPRLRVHLPGRVATADGAGQPVDVLDLSATGAQIACSYMAAGHIIPRDRSMVDAVGFALRLAIGFDGKAPADVTEAVEAVVAYSRRVSQDDYRFGLRFGEIPPSTLSRLLASLENAEQQE